MDIALQHRPGPFELLRREAGGLGSVLFLALLAGGFYAPGPGKAQIFVLLVLVVATGAVVSGRLGGAPASTTVPSSSKPLARLVASRHDFFLGAMLLLTAHSFVQISQAQLGSDLYPVIYLLLLGMGTFVKREVALALVVAAVSIECVCHLAGHPPGLEASAASWPVLCLRVVFLGFFGGVYVGLLRLESKRHRRATQAAVDKMRTARETSARDYRLVVMGEQPARALVSRQEAVEMLREDAIGTISASIDETLQLLRASLGAQSAVLLWLDEEGLRLKCQAAVCPAPEHLALTLQPGEGALAGILRRREPIVLRDIRPNYRGLGYYRSGAQVAVRQFLGAPVMERETLKGILCLDRSDSTPFVASDTELALRAAGTIVRTVQTERLFLNMEAARYELDRFYEASRQLNCALTPLQVHEVALACAMDLCQFDFAAIVLTREESGRRHHEIVRVQGDLPWSGELEGLSFGHNTGLVSLAVEMQVALPHSGVYKPRQNVVFTVGRVLEGMQSLLILPLVAHDQALGAFVLACEAPSVFSPERREILGVVANQVAISLQNAHMYETMELMATTDGLTGLTNHRSFNQCLDEVIARSQRGASPFSILLTDIDHFKSVNDTYGHPVGDEVLRRVSKTIRSVLRQTDIPARYGGEEFIVALEGTDLDGGIQIAERLRMEVEALEFTAGEKEFSVTMSFGVAEYPHDAQEKSPLIDVADQALYYAKKHGRNQVKAWRDINRTPSSD